MTVELCPRGACPETRPCPEHEPARWRRLQAGVGRTKERSLWRKLRAAMIEERLAYLRSLSSEELAREWGGFEALWAANL